MLEHELRELQIDWPATPDVAGAIGARLAAPPPKRRWWLARPAWQVAVAAVALLLAVVMAVPPTRAAVLDLLGLRSVRIEHREPQPSTFGSGLVLGDAVTLEQARRRANFPLRVPAAVGRPDAVYLDDDRVNLVYRARPGLREASTTGAGLLVTQMRATITPVIQKTLGSAAKFERLTVDGDPAYFISGADHGFAYVPAGGDIGFEQQRLAGPTLLVERSDGVLLRIEGRLTRDQAVADRRVAALERLPAGEAGLDAVPVRDRRLVEQPAQVDLAAVDHGGEVDEAALEVADDDVQALELLQPEGDLERGAGALGPRPGAAGGLGEQGELVVEPAVRQHAAGVADAAHGRADDRAQRVGLVGCPVARVQHRPARFTPPGGRRHGGTG